MINKIKNSKLEKARTHFKFWQKRLWYNNYINKNVYDKSGDYMTLVISRSNILEESFNQFKTTENLNLKKSVQIHFIDEVAQDVGGVFREWYFSLFNEIFNQKYNLFYEVQNKYGPTSMFIPTTKATNISDSEEAYYNFIGKILGKGIYDKTLLKVNLNRVILRKILKQQITLDDLKYLDYQLFSSLESIINNSVEGLEMPFTWMITNQEGTSSEIELCENGINIMITDENKAEFVEKV